MYIITIKQSLQQLICEEGRTNGKQHNMIRMRLFLKEKNRVTSLRLLADLSHQRAIFTACLSGGTTVCQQGNQQHTASFVHTLEADMVQQEQSQR